MRRQVRDDIILVAEKTFTDIHAYRFLKGVFNRDISKATNECVICMLEQGVLFHQALNYFISLSKRS